VTCLHQEIHRKKKQPNNTEVPVGVVIVIIGVLVVIMLAIGPKVRGFKPGRGVWIFKDDKNT
jgi:hypothetical protein